VTATRYLTTSEAQLIQRAAEDWLRVRDIEFNAGETAAAVLCHAVLRQEGCTRDDIASLGRTVLLATAHEREPVAIVLVRPEEEDRWSGRVSVLSDLGLACIGQVRGSEIRIPHTVARLVGFGEERPAKEARHAGA
jgi:transcription elongation GreA/GreB family factor